MAALIVSHGYGVELYASGTCFLESAAKSAAACVILDGQLGDMSGIELALHLSNLGFAFPTVFVTGSDNEALRAQAAELNFVAFLQKPAAAKRLMDAITLALMP